MMAGRARRTGYAMMRTPFRISFADPEATAGSKLPRFRCRQGGAEEVQHIGPWPAIPRRRMGECREAGRV